MNVMSYTCGWDGQWTPVVSGDPLQCECKLIHLAIHFIRQQNNLYLMIFQTMLVMKPHIHLRKQTWDAFSHIVCFFFAKKSTCFLNKHQ